MAAYSEASLHGRWVRSPEDDTDSELVFRPASYAFPPSRGRTSIELRTDGTYVEGSPGPVDVPEESSGHWWLDGNRLVLESDGEHPGHAWEIVSAGADGLTLKS